MSIIVTALTRIIALVAFVIAGAAAYMHGDQTTIGDKITYIYLCALYLAIVGAWSRPS